MLRVAVLPVAYIGLHRLKSNVRRSSISAMCRKCLCRRKVTSRLWTDACRDARDYTGSKRPRLIAVWVGGRGTSQYCRVRRTRLTNGFDEAVVLRQHCTVYNEDSGSRRQDTQAEPGPLGPGPRRSVKWAPAELRQVEWLTVPYPLSWSCRWPEIPASTQQHQSTFTLRIAMQMFLLQCPMKYCSMPTVSMVTWV